MSQNRTSPMGLLIAGVFLASGAWLSLRDGPVRVNQAHGKYGQHVASLALDRPVAVGLGLGMLVIGVGIAVISIRTPVGGEQNR